MNLEFLQRELADASADEILLRAWTEFGPDVAVSSSFQTQSVPLLHMIARVVPALPVIFLDTGYHFPETLEFRDRLVREWGLNLRIAGARIGRSEFIRSHGDDLYRRDPDLCCYINKVEPMREAVAGLRAWISGIRRDQTVERSAARVVELDATGMVRVHPLLEWTGADVATYMAVHELPMHPLAARGYPSVGCAPCTSPVSSEEDPRAGRWRGTAKTECGLHTAPTAVRKQPGE